MAAGVWRAISYPILKSASSLNGVTAHTFAHKGKETQARSQWENEARRRQGTGSAQPSPACCCCHLCTLGRATSPSEACALLLHTPTRTPTYPASHANTHPSVHCSLRSLKSRLNILHTTFEKLPKAQLLRHQHDHTMKIPCHEASFHVQNYLMYCVRLPSGTVYQVHRQIEMNSMF